MFRKTVSTIMLFLLITSTLTLAFKIQSVKADDGTIYINADGSITPSTAPIYSADNITYTFAGNISYPDYEGILIERTNVIIDGNGYAEKGNQSGNGLCVTGANNVTIKNINVLGFQNGVYLDPSDNTTINGNNITSNNCGIYLYAHSENDKITGNNVRANSRYGILTLSSSSEIIEGNSIANNFDMNSLEDGIVIGSSNNDTISGNSVIGNGDCGIWAGSSCSNCIEGNNFTSNGIGVTLESNCYYNNVTGNNITDSAGPGIFFEDASSNSISQNNVTENLLSGIWFQSSYYNRIDGNEISHNTDYGGIWLWASYYNIIDGNSITANRGENGGIYISSSRYNLIIENNITDNDYSIRLGNWGTNNEVYNTIYHNNFINNQLLVEISPYSTNTWDNGYPSGGNYWSDYNGTDSYNGPHQNLIGSDGIGDTPIGSNSNIDHYPLMKPYARPTSNSSFTASVYTYPNILNLRSKGSWVTAYLRIPQVYNVPDVNMTTIMLNDSVSYKPQPIDINVYNGVAPEFVITYNRTKLVNLIASENVTFGNVTLSLTGQLTNGTQFEGSCIITVSALMGDVNCDGKVDLLDLTAVAIAYHSQPGDANWNDNANFAPPWDSINLADVATLASHYGQQYP